VRKISRNKATFNERLYRQVSKVEQLQGKLRELESIRASWEARQHKLTARIAAYKEICDEWDWFFEHSLDILVVVDRDGNLHRVNSGATVVLGWSKDALLANSIRQFIHPDDQEKALTELSRINEGKHSLNFETRCLSKSGQWHWICWTTPGRTSATEKVYAIGRDITERKLNEEELLYRAQHDILTGLSNRLVFDQALKDAIARAGRNPAVHVALILIDLDGFKKINDRHGHAAGDMVLRTIAKRFLNTKRKTDLVCRLGGDEFAWIMEGPAPLLHAHIAERLVELSSQPVEIPDAMVQVGCSVGIAVFPDGANDANDLFEKADSALYSVKKNGKGGWQLHSSKML
jgi:diguanylate cyclase (GGDEF)-like protein/PAS domain S-box-containing protein